MSPLSDIYKLPTGFRSAAIHAGVKKDPAKADMTLIVSDRPATLAGVFTMNKVKAAPVKWCTRQLTRARGQAIITNSGNANACTGAAGDADAQTMASHTATALGLQADDISVCSTGCIGIPLPMDTITSGIDALIPALSPSDITAPQGMLTSDTGQKVATAELEIDGQHVTITAMAKGAGMIEPNMATMLCFILTDATVEADALQTALAEATHASFNRISVDGDMSTNDTVLVLANGAANNNVLSAAHPAWAAFTQCLNAITLDLALKIVADGEGTTKVITLNVQGAASNQEADIAARRIANSLLVKTAWAGNYPVWGRLMDVLGYTDITLEEQKIDITIGDLQVTRGGLDAGAQNDEVRTITSQPEYSITIDLGIGPGRTHLYTTDCTEEYVRLNMV